MAWPAIALAQEPPVEIPRLAEGQAEPISGPYGRFSRQRVVGAAAGLEELENLLAGNLEAEAPLFVESARLTVAILDEVLSDQVVFAAGTSLLDLDWAARDRAAQLDLKVVYPPRTVVYRPSSALEAERRMGLDCAGGGDHAR